MKNKKTIIATICIVAVLILSVTIGVVVSKNNKVTVEPETTTEVVETTTEIITEPETTEPVSEEVTTEVESQPETTAKAPETTKSNTTTAKPSTTTPAATAAQPETTQPSATAAASIEPWEWTEADVKELVNKTRNYIKSKGYPYGEWNATYYYAEDGTRVDLSYGNPENTQYYRPDVMINELGLSKQDCMNKMLDFLYSEVDDWGGRNKTVGCFYAKDGAGWEIYVVAD